MVGVDGDVEAHELVKARVIEAEHTAEVGGVVEALVLLDDAVKVRTAVDERAHLGQPRDQVEHVLLGVDNFFMKASEIVY